MIEEIGREEWQECKNEENNGLLVILGFNWKSHKCIEICKNFLKNVWKKRNENGNEIIIENLNENNNLEEHNYFRRNIV